MRETVALLFVAMLTTTAFANSGKKVFETYCWGCHHQTAVAFGPPFEEIALKRTANEIRAMIIDPKSVSEVFGYKRNAMPPFKLSEDELKNITSYILSYAPAKNENNITDSNSSKIDKGAK